MQAHIRVLILESNYLVRTGIEALVNGQSDFFLCPSIESVANLADGLKLYAPDVIVADYNHFSEGLELVRTIRKTCPSASILAITDPRSRGEITKALEAGATSFLLKECDQEEIIEAIFKTAENQKFLCGRILDLLVTENRETLPAHEISCEGLNITDREIEIIRLVAEGLSNKEIAEKLFLSTHTVTTHRKNIMNKLQVNNTAGLVLYAVRNDLIGPNKFLFS
jgi:DNA-binding NarL/FixJ family response regulator